MDCGKIYIGCMNMRGVRSPKPNDAIILNVTSMQSKNSTTRKDLSPMTPIANGYKGFINFEHYWQSGKIFENMSVQDIHNHKEWWKNLRTPKRRYPKFKNKKVVCSMFQDNIERDYIRSRKDIYLPEYYNLVKNTKTIQFYHELYKSGKSIVIYDFDGPRNEKKEQITCEATHDFIKEKLNDQTYPFGHGYIVALLLQNIDYTQII